MVYNLTDVFRLSFLAEHLRRHGSRINEQTAEKRGSNDARPRASTSRMHGRLLEWIGLWDSRVAAL